MIIYWGIYAPQDFLAINYIEPQPVSDILSSIKLESPPTDNFKYCPAVRDQLKNVFRLQFPFDNDISFDEEKLTTSRFDQEFFDQMIKIRSLKDKNLAFNLKYLLVSEESVEVESTACWFSQNDFVNKTMLIPGKFNIGKWTRPLDCAFLVKDGFNSIKINRGADYSYIRIHTDEEVVFKKFYITDRLKQVMLSNLKTRQYKIKPIEKLAYYYNLYAKAKMHKLIMAEIKSNLME
jgi:hypothetical protein